MEVFRHLKVQLPDFNPSKLMTDYEPAVFMSFEKIFGNVKSTLCYFHYANVINIFLFYVGNK